MPYDPTEKPNQYGQHLSKAVAQIRSLPRSERSAIENRNVLARAGLAADGDKSNRACL